MFDIVPNTSLVKCSLFSILYSLRGVVVKVLDSKSRGTQPFILLKAMKGVPGISGNLVVKSKLPPRSGSSLEAVEPHP